MFRKAERKRSKLRLALCGPSGSGKTFSALLIAKGIGGRVAMMDTEHGSGELYADNPMIGMAYDVVQVDPPFKPSRYVEVIKAAKDAGYDVIILDSLSHAWMGEGGLLEMVDMAAKAVRDNSFAGWKKVKPDERKFLAALTSTDIHIIATVRTKTAWEIQKDEKTGKTRPIKIGLKPEQRDGLEYEFTTVLDLSVDGNVASVSKDRTGLFAGQFFVPNEAIGQRLIEWLNSGAPQHEEATAGPRPPVQPPAQPAHPPVNTDQSSAPPAQRTPTTQAGPEPPGSAGQPPVTKAGGGSPTSTELARHVWIILMDIFGGAVEEANKALADLSRFERDGQVYEITSKDQLLAWAPTKPKWMGTIYGRAKALYKERMNSDYERQAA